MSFLEKISWEFERARMSVAKHRTPPVGVSIRLMVQEDHMGRKLM